MKLFYIQHLFTDDATYHINLDYLVRAPDEEILYLHISDKVEEILLNDENASSWTEIEILGKKFELGDFVIFPQNKKPELYILIKEVDIEKLPTLK